MGVRALTQAEIDGYRGAGIPSGKYVRYFCPLHGGDRQRSFQLNPETGHFKCYTCGEWGYLAEAQEKHRQAWRDEQQRARTSGAVRVHAPKPLPLSALLPEPEPSLELERLQYQLEMNLPESLGERYLAYRGIPLEVARRFGVGYAPDGAWPHLKDGRPVRQWKHGRLTFPHANAAADVVNLYGRAVAREGSAELPKGLKHDHLPGARGIFNPFALYGDRSGSVFLTEGVFDALSLIAAGYEFTCAIFGVAGIRWNWIKSRRIVLCLDMDQAGQSSWRKLAWEGTVLGFEVYWLPPEAYHGHKDLNSLWRASGAIDLPDWKSEGPIHRCSWANASAPPITE